MKKTGLRYLTDNRPGYIRKKNGHGFRYLDTTGAPVSASSELERIIRLAIPPAWTDVWISPDPMGHIQATGRDDKGRKQYRYHADWTKITQEDKFDRMAMFGDVLPSIRKKVRSDMEKPGLLPEKVLATVVWLLDKTYIRIGNREYAKENNHFGLTTMRARHVDVAGNSVRFEFVGKSGKVNRVLVSHPRVARTIRKLEELPGYELFRYMNREGQLHTVTSQEVNDYLREVAGEDISAKYFRTWGGTVLAAVLLNEKGDFSAKKEGRKNITDTVKRIAGHLRNTPAVCRRYYIHPAIPRAYLSHALISDFRAGLNRPASAELTREESAVSSLLKQTK